MRILWMAWLALGFAALQAEASMFSMESAAESQELADESAPPAPDPEIADDSLASEYAAECSGCADDDCGCCDGCIPPLFSYTCGCPEGCWDGCGCPNEKLFGLVAKSDYCFNSFISPISNPLFFEDPRQLSEVRFIYAHHIIPGDVPVLQGGHANFYAMQARARLTERVSLIATKDGYIDMDTPGVGDSDGWADVAAGLKFTVFRNPERQFLLSTGMVYEIDMGEHQVFQGRGDGEFHFFVTGGKQFGCRTHWLSASGFRIPADHTARSQMWYWSNHFDYQFTDMLYGLVEFNWFHWLRSGDGDLGTNGFEGLDLMNLGSTGVAGNDIVTCAVGGKAKPYRNMEIGAGWEFPLTQRRDILEDRFYADLIIRY
jgi:hypothetical protein